MRGRFIAAAAGVTLVASSLSLAAFAPAAGAAVPDALTYSHIADVAGSACETSPASQMAVQPTGVLADGSGGFYVSVTDAVHSMVCHVSASGVVTGAAGNGAPGYLPAGFGDGVAAVKAQVYNPYGLALSNGNLYIADRMNSRIRKVSASGVITTVAGTGVAGYAGDGGPATSAELNEPTGVAVDAAGDLFIADTNNNRIREVTPTGTILTVAGNGVAGSSGDGGPAVDAELNMPEDVAVGPTSTLYVVDTHNNRVLSVVGGLINAFAGTGAAGYSGDGGPATQATLKSPTGIALGSGGQVYIADANNSVVRRVDSNGNITTFAGTGVVGYSGDGGPATKAELSWPLAVSVDGSGGVLIADNGYNNRVRYVDPNGVMSTVAGNGTMGLAGDGGSSTTSELSQDNAVAVDSAGNVYIADSQNEVVRRVSASTGVITTIVGGADGTHLSFPSGLAVNSAGDVFIADSWDHRVLEWYPSGPIAVVAGTGAAGYSGDGGYATGARLNDPVGLAFDGAGNLYIADSGNNVIRKVTRGRISTFAGTGAKTGPNAPLGDGGYAFRATFDNPVGLGVDLQHGKLFVADQDNQRIRAISLQTWIISTVMGTGVVGFAGDGSPATATALNYPTGVTVDSGGRVYVADYGNCIVREIGLNGTVSTIAGWTPAGGVKPTCGDYEDPSNNPRAWILHCPMTLAFNAAGNLYVADSVSNKVEVMSP